MRHRTFNRLRAEFGGYFWIPCPRCGQMFGGHEGCGVDWELGVPCGRTTCSDCPEERTLIDGQWVPGYWFENGEGRLSTRVLLKEEA